MSLVLLLVAVVVAGAAVAVGTGRLVGGLEEPTTSRPLRALPDGPLAAEDIDRVRFSLGLRGYRMDEVDAALDRVRDEVAERDARLAELEALLRSAAPVDPPWRAPAGDAPLARDAPQDVPGDDRGVSASDPGGRPAGTAGAASEPGTGR
ncbi:DivIVA domain-containing protein [Pseudokineococcus basanitobsidens]|uniref:DivIVA domain-containing protein n=1 Tax=Pseudokineococcus basanitobsidens TaxID=1926649 RepID=A0ABU8RIQ6_9ACTN